MVAREFLAGQAAAHTLGLSAADLERRALNGARATLLPAAERQRLEVKPAAGFARSREKTIGAKVE